MGVPAFFRWLSRKYPSVIIECIENKKEADNGTFVYEDATLPNPNGVEFDNLYLDMNGIIHPCTHPEDKPPPKDENEMMEAIFDCIDRLFAIVRPRKILYLAIDGVAPRAKMNQQRSRRFRASKETSEKALELQKIREDLVQRGCTLPPQCVKGSTFDSNCITPGTPFMDKLSKCLQYYIHDRMNNNVAWKNIKVILSDANVPGEGEHKIMDFIRKQRGQPTHDPNTQHVLCGADADLIMLGLATHEPNFTIIREEFLPNKPRPCEICNLFGHEAKECSGIDSFGRVDSTKLDVKTKETNFIFVRLSVLKEYLERELEMPNLPFPYEFERVLDDWVFMCFFVGNDFLPHLPSLEIREGAIDRLVNLYKKCVYKTGGYLTDSGMVALERVEMIMTDLGYMEDNIFKERQRNEIRFRENAKRRMLQETMKKPDYKVFLNTQFDATPLGSNVNPSQLTNARQEISSLRKTDTQTGNDMTQKRKLEAKEGTEQNDEDDEPNDEVRLWELGFKDRYYQSKFDVEPENLQFRNTVALEYVRGLCWVLKYYYQGCASWSWYFPYHYAPFASDFLNITGLNTKFDKGKPFDPLEQLMGVFPAASKIHVPEIFSQLMEDPMSLIIDFYPEDFKIDLNGKKFAWQGVALLPFVDEKRLFKALQPLREKLNQAEQNRNETGNDKLFLRHNSCIHKDIIQIYNSSSVKNEIPIVLDGMSGTIGKCKENIPINASLVSPLDCHMELTSNQVITVFFNNPLYDDDHIFEAKQLKNAINPKRVLHSGLQQHSSYRQSMGFSGNSNQEHTLSLAGRRMINNYLPEQYQQRSQQNRYPQHQRNPLMRGNQSRHGYNEERSVHNNEYGPTFRHYGNTNGSRGHQRQNNPYHRYAPYDYHK